MSDLDLTPDSLEASIEAMTEVDEFNSAKDYEHYIVLSKKDLTNFCRITEPLTKQAIDDYGKCIFVHCLDNDTVQLGYTNTPYVLQAVVANKSGKTVKDFAITISVLKKLVNQTFASLILVEQDGEINIALCESLLYLETKPLSLDQYQVEKKETTGTIDKEVALYTFKKVGSSLALTERASEKVVVVSNKTVNFNTGIFAACTQSPFSGDESFVIYKQIAEIISVFAELCTINVGYGIVDETLVLSADNFYAEVQVGLEDKVKEFLSASAESNLNFNATIEVVNDNILRIISVVGGLEYLSDIVSLEFTNESLNLVITSQNQSKKSVYTFPIFAGKPEEVGSMKVTIPVLKLFLNIVGADCKYSFTSTGLGIETPKGKFIIRRS